VTRGPSLSHLAADQIVHWRAMATAKSASHPPHLDVFLQRSAWLAPVGHSRETAARVDAPV